MSTDKYDGKTHSCMSQQEEKKHGQNKAQQKPNPTENKIKSADDKIFVRDINLLVEWKEELSS